MASLFNTRLPLLLGNVYQPQQNLGGSQFFVQNAGSLGAPNIFSSNVTNPNISNADYFSRMNNLEVETKSELVSTIGEYQKIQSVLTQNLPPQLQRSLSLQARNKAFHIGILSEMLKEHAIQDSTLAALPPNSQEARKFMDLSIMSRMIDKVRFNLAEQAGELSVLGDNLDPNSQEAKLIKASLIRCQSMDQVFESKHFNIGQQAGQYLKSIFGL